MAVPDSTCVGCAIPIVRKRRGLRDKRRYCSRACAFEYQQQWQHRGANRDRKHPPKLAPEVRPCRVCQQTFELRARASAALCSDACRKAEQRRLWTECYATLIVTTTCETCGVTMAVRDIGRAGKPKRFCSSTCRRKGTAFRRNKRISKQIRRARRRSVPAEHIDPLDVFERDAWRCQLCGCATPKQLRGQMVDAAPELDHIVPLARGGSHTWANVQCACRRCNGSKGDLSSSV